PGPDASSHNRWSRAMLTYLLTAIGMTAIGVALTAIVRSLSRRSRENEQEKRWANSQRRLAHRFAGRDSEPVCGCRGMDERCPMCKGSGFVSGEYFLNARQGSMGLHNDGSIKLDTLGKSDMQAVSVP